MRSVQALTHKRARAHDTKPGTVRHMQLAKSLGMSKVIVVVNKMDDRSIERTTKSRFTVLLPSLSLSVDSFWPPSSGCCVLCYRACAWCTAHG
jgi:translation elongation factor EF-1alpha